jgi:hypothetical protein
LAATAIIIGVFAFVVTSGSPKPINHANHGHSSKARDAVIAALSTTTESGNFTIAYQFSGVTPATTATTTTQCPPETACSASNDNAPTITGQATLDTDPYAIVADSDVSNFGQVTVRANDTNVWEEGGADYGLAPSDPGTDSATASGSPLSGFANLVDGTLGDKEGALAMMSLASSSGYLGLEQQQVTSADETGNSSVDGVPVTQYKVFLNPQEEGDLSGLSTQQTTAIDNALTLLNKYGYQGTTVIVSVDADGYVRETQSSAQFADGSTAGSQAIFSDFGCAGTVLMPGQTGASSPPAGCVSPDTALPASPTSSTSSDLTPPSTIPTTAVPLGGPVTIPPASSTTTPSSTTSTSPSSTTTTTAAAAS